MANRSYSSVEFLHAGMILPKFFADPKILTIRGRTKKLAPKTRFQGPRRITGKSQRNKKILVLCENLGKNIHINALKPLLNSFLPPKWPPEVLKKSGKIGRKRSKIQISRLKFSKKSSPGEFLDQGPRLERFSRKSVDPNATCVVHFLVHSLLRGEYD